ncbi:hypothetical protein HDU93_004761 [Gonapodya sp. JEL0774]|nr:hypothetical protein HDU93_004761 [Gonapodya sp. JEL0774]
MEDDEPQYENRRRGGGAERPARGRRGPAPPARRGGGGGRSGGARPATRERGAKREPRQPQTAEGLDKDLEAYMQGGAPMEEDNTAAVAPAAGRQVVSYEDVQVVG